MEASQPKRARETVERKKVGGKATTSSKGKAPAKKASKGVSLSGPSTSTEQDEWLTPDEEEVDYVQGRSESEESETSDRGETSSSCVARPKRAFGCAPAHPRNEHVSDKLRSKIRKGEYIDFKDLLPHHRDEKPRKRFTINEGFFEEVEDNSTMVFYSWIDAFITFMSIHLEFYPAEVQGMLRHFEIVKGFHVAGKDGIEYDYLFRRMKSRNSDMVWGEYIAEIAANLKERNQTQQKKAEQPPKKKPKRSGTCNKFNSAEGCKFGMKCYFAHKCRKCASPDHPEYRCSRK